MLRRPLSLLSGLGTAALFGYIAWVGWRNLGPRKPEVDGARQELANQLIPVIVEDIRRSRGPIRYVGLLHFGNDPTDYITTTLRRSIERTGILDLQDRTLVEKVRRLLNLRHPSYTTLDSALAEARELGVPGVLYGTIHAFESHSRGAVLDLEVNLANVSTGELLFTKRYSAESSPLASLTSAMHAVTTLPWFQRLAGWTIAVLLLPVFTITFLRATVRKGSNKANAFILGIYTLADGLLAWLLAGGAFDSWFPVLVFAAAVTAALLYNIRIMTLALRLEET